MIDDEADRVHLSREEGLTLMLEVQIPMDGIVWAKVLLKDPSSQDKDGQDMMPPASWLEWSDPMPFFMSPDLCITEEGQHMETICVECMDTWGIDYWMKVAFDLPDHGKYVSSSAPEGLD